MTQGDLLLTDGIKIELEREEMFDSIEKELEEHAHVMAYYYDIPKHAKLNHDIHLNVVVQPAFYYDFIHHKRSISTQWGNVLFYEDDYYESPDVVIHYDNLIKVYLKILRPQDLQPSHQYRTIEISYDPYGIMTYVSELSEKSQYKITYEELDNWRTKFFANYYEFYRSINHQELYQATHCLDVMRWLMATMWLVKANIKPNQYLDWSYMEGYDSLLTPEQRETLKKWQVSGERPELKQTVQLVLEEFKMLHNQLCDDLGVLEDQDYVERIINRAKVT